MIIKVLYKHLSAILMLLNYIRNNINNKNVTSPNRIPNMNLRYWRKGTFFSIIITLY